MFRDCSALVEVSCRLSPTSRTATPPYDIGEPVRLVIDRFSQELAWSKPIIQSTRFQVGLAQTPTPGELILIASLFSDDAIATAEDHMSRLNNHWSGFKMAWAFEGNAVAFYQQRPTEDFALHLLNLETGYEGTRAIIESGAGDLGLIDREVAQRILPRRRLGWCAMTTPNHLLFGITI